MVQRERTAARAQFRAATLLLNVDMLLWKSEFSPFMRRAQMRYCSKLIIVPLSVFHRMADSVGDPKGDLIFVINAGRSGSTLLMKVKRQYTYQQFK